jgi:hypothetical protein
MLGRIIALSLTVFISIGLVLRSALGEVAPVNVSGSWTIDSQAGPVMCRFQKYAGNNFTGSCVGQDGQGTVTGTINGKEVQWRWQWVAYTGNSADALDFEGTLASDDAITGSVKWNILPFKTTGRLHFTARRQSGQQIGATTAAEQVDLLLVLSSDVSRSVNHPKFLLQREGYAAAISDPQVIEAIKSGPHQSIALCYIEWSGLAAQKLLIDWSLLDAPDAARKFGNQLLELPRSLANRTSISGGIEFAIAQLERSPYVAPRRTIDISGDGANNDGRDVTLARDEALTKGIVINGLVILSERRPLPVPWPDESLGPIYVDHTNPPGGLENYYRENVVGGPGAFVMVAKNHHDFIRKMIAEITNVP